MGEFMSKRRAGDPKGRVWIGQWSWVHHTQEGSLNIQTLHSLNGNKKPVPFLFFWLSQNATREGKDPSKDGAKGEGTEPTAHARIEGCVQIHWMKKCWQICLDCVNSSSTFYLAAKTQIQKYNKLWIWPNSQTLQTFEISDKIFILSYKSCIFPVSVGLFPLTTNLRFCLGKSAFCVWISGNLNSLGKCFDKRSLCILLFLRLLK